ncbi:MAG: hypothetical protein HN391_02735 [Anaerolineae bacterium]|jgi:hypothetical protein|nr:hypothetical protein [Anaerolineae bacterium]
MKEIAIVIGVIVLVFLVMDYNTRLEKLNQLNEKALTARAEATQAMQTQVALQTQIAIATSDPVTEGEARKNGEIQEGDQLIIPMPAPGTLPMEIIPSTPAPERLMKWQIWYALFFER